MSRSGYTYDNEQWDLIRWRGAVKSAIRGKRGQAFLQELKAAIEALPTKSLIRNDLENGDLVCALGAVGKTRGLDMSDLDPYDREGVAVVFNIPHALACEIFFMNDEWDTRETPEARYYRMLEWVRENIK